MSKSKIIERSNAIFIVDDSTIPSSEVINSETTLSIVPSNFKILSQKDLEDNILIPNETSSSSF